MELENLCTVLQHLPRATILHCLQQKASSNKFNGNDVVDIDEQ